MMQHFKLQSLIFYGVAISSVLLLFKFVTAYGETNVKAPAPISGDYRLTLDQNLPNCLQLSDLVLSIQQSGIYVNGSLLTADSNAHLTRTGEKRPSLTGKLNQQQLQLSGNIPISNLCNQPVTSTVDAVAIKSQIGGKNLAGKITLSDTSREIAFTAKQVPQVESSGANSH